MCIVVGCSLQLFHDKRFMSRKVEIEILQRGQKICHSKVQSKQQAQVSVKHKTIAHHQP
jgi:hypothetical protein